MHSEKIVGALIKFCLAILFLKFVVFGIWLKTDLHKGTGYSILPPVGWGKIKDDPRVQPVFAATEKPNTVTFTAPENIYGTEIPVATISVLVVKLANPTWMEDEFPELLGALGKAGYKVLDHGQIKIDIIIFHWVFYQDPNSPAVSLEFYANDEVNKLYKLQYTAADMDTFRNYRPIFESTKDTIKFSTSLW